jgi:two-component system cell cycle response regulator
MSARILIVDDVPANVKLLEARLTAEYFEVVVASNGPEALDICRKGQCDVVLLDVIMPGMDGFEVCRRLKADPKTMHLPVVMITALDSPADRVAGLEAGADDFLTKPVKDLALTARVRSLARLKMLTDELGARAATASQMDLADWAIDDAAPGKILLVDDRPSSSEGIVAYLARNHEVTVESDPQEALFQAAEHDFDLALVSLDSSKHDGLRLCSQLRSLDRTRTLPILAIDGPESESRLMRALDLGVNDYIVRPIDRNELMARVRTQIRRKRYADRLRDNMQMTLEMAITDSLTGLHNRRYFERHLATMVDQATTRGRPLSLLIIDIDHFKAINDTYGHLAGDKVLKEFARRIQSAVRGIDLAGRFGGEEFVVAMPDTHVSVAYLVAERLRSLISAEPFKVGEGLDPIVVTVSIGVGAIESPTDTPMGLLARADAALYQAKRSGRNRVASAAA